MSLSEVFFLFIDQALPELCRTHPEGHGLDLLYEIRGVTALIFANL
jgi:hypothetical protein